jgi:hypothetical protein
MTTPDQPRRDPRHCPRCGARGILPLDQPKEPSGAIQDPVMLCPVCGDEFRATGIRRLGAAKPPDLATATDEDIERWAEEFAAAILGRQ